MRPFFKDEGFNFQTEIALGATYHQAADVGEVLATVERIRNGHAQSWVDEWSATADRLAAEATANAAAGRSDSAARQFLRVSTYYSLAGCARTGRRRRMSSSAARAYALTDEVIGQITCPVLVTDPDHEQFWPGQSRELYDKLPAGKALIRFTEEEGADSHCGACRQRHPGGAHLRLARPAHPRLNRGFPTVPLGRGS